MKSELFRQKSMERVTSPDQLDDYIRVTGPSVWVVLAAVLVLLAAVLVWAATGSLPTTVAAKGVAQGGIVTCYLSPEDAALLAPGMAAMAGDARGEVQAVSETPLSAREAADALGSDYLAQQLAPGEWSVPITIRAPQAQDGLVDAVVTVDTVRPIDFILN